jgi:hypothetical protein
MSSCVSEVKVSTPTAQPTPTPQLVELEWDIFPLAKGAYWVYEGPVRWQEGVEVREKHFTWKMEVVETMERGPVKGYLLKGHPYDLTWYEPGREPEPHVIIQVGPKYYDSDLEAWERLKDEEDYLVDLVHESQIFLDLPLWPEKFFGDTAQFTRSDFMYYWLVEEEQTVQLKEIKGIPASEEWTQYTLSLRTLPDHEILEFVPGLGITHYVYGHHGTVSNVDVRLVEYHPGQ